MFSVYICIYFLLIFDYVFILVFFFFFFFFCLFVRLNFNTFAVGFFSFSLVSHDIELLGPAGFSWPDMMQSMAKSFQHA